MDISYTYFMNIRYMYCRDSFLSTNFRSSYPVLKTEFQCELDNLDLDDFGT